MFATASFRPTRRAANGAVSFYSRYEPIPMERLRTIAPSVFAVGAHESRSEKYSYIPTSDVLTALMQEGFEPFGVAQGGSRDAQKRDFTKHSIRLRHSSQPKQVGDTFTEIILQNSHDGTSAYRLIAGVYRLVCANGMVVSQSVIDDIRIPHKGDVSGLVIDGCIEIMNQLPEVSDSIGEMSGLRLNREEQMAFAVGALAARYEDDKAPIQPEQVITARRQADVGGSIWQTLNIAQENLIRGGVRYQQESKDGRRTNRATREVKGIDQNTAVNRALWAMAEELRRMKQPAAA